MAHSSMTSRLSDVSGRMFERAREEDSVAALSGKKAIELVDYATYSPLSATDLPKGC